MTREEAIRWLEDIHRRFNPTGENLENEGGDVHLQALDMAIEALSAEAEKIFCSPDAEWIPVSERLPENNGCMLVTIDDAIEFGKYEDGEWSIWVCEHWDEWDAKGVTAWMPLPEPYREDGEKE